MFRVWFKPLDVNHLLITLCNTIIYFYLTTDLLDRLSELALNVTHSLTITYVAKVSTTVLLGVFKSTYIDKSGTTHYQVVTQTAPYVARRVLPCFDEPKFKAVYNVNVTTPVGFTATSNGVLKNVTNVG